MSYLNRRIYNLNLGKKPQQEMKKVSPFKNSDIMLKQIYEDQAVYKSKKKQLPKKNQGKYHLPLTTRKNQPENHDTKYRSYLQNLNISHQNKANNRYKDTQREDPKRSQWENDKSKTKSGRQEYMSQNKNDVQQNRQMFKIRSRKSMSGSLKKKNKDLSQHINSVNCTPPVDLNIHEEAMKLYKESKFSEAIKLYEVVLQRNPQFSEGYYYIALSYLNRHDYQKGLQYLEKLIRKFPKFSKRSMFLFAAISAKNTNKNDEAIDFCCRGIDFYPTYFDLFMYRAKVYEQKQMFEQAHKDYEQVIKNSKDNAQAMLFNAICLKNMNLLSSSLSALNSALYADSKGQMQSRILLQRLKLNLELNNAKAAKKDLKKLNQIGKQNSQLHFYDGKIHLLQKIKKQALICFEKSIRIGDDKIVVASALIQIAKTKIEEKDFYSAFHHINRSDFLGIESEQIQKFKLFTEGVIFLMKRKINEGINNFYQLVQKYRLDQYFEQMYYLYRAFGHFMQSKHNLAIKDYIKASEYIEKDKHIMYNQQIAEAILQVEKKEFQKAMETFDKSQETISKGSTTLKVEPFIYKAITFIEQIKFKLATKTNKDEIETLEDIFLSLKELDRAYDINDSSSNMLYLRSLIYMYLGKTDEALQDIIKAISKSEENVAKYFLFRGLAHQTLDNKKQALNDFNICINLDDKFKQAYLERAKLLFNNGQASKGLEDIQKIKQVFPQEDTKYHQACLFYIEGDYDIAEQCIQHIQNLQKRIYIETLINFKQLKISSAQEKMTSQADKSICDIILGKVEEQDPSKDELILFSKVEYYCYLGIKHYHLNNLSESINNFVLAIKQKNLSDLEENNLGATEEREEDQDEEIEIDQQTKKQELNYLNYNLFLAYLKYGDLKKGYQIFVRDILPSRAYFLRSEQIASFSRLLFQAMKQKQSQQEPTQQKNQMEILLFRSRLGEASCEVEIQLPSFILKTKLCYLTPYAKQIFQNYRPIINSSFILQKLCLGEVENKPEPPWVKRNNQDLVFTDEIIDINVEFQTTQHDEQEEEEDYDEEQEGENEDEEDNESYQEEHQVFDPKKFRDQMKLDLDIQNKLKKIMEKKKQQQK